jgi:small subunit ribosomal protein S6
MNNYEAMVIIKSDMAENDRQAALATIHDTVTKNSGTIAQAQVWAERRRLAFPIKKHIEGTYYLMQFNAPTSAVSKIKQAYAMNEQILRMMITQLE